MHVLFVCRFSAPLMRFGKGKADKNFSFSTCFCCGTCLFSFFVAFFVAFYFQRYAIECVVSWHFLRTDSVPSSPQPPIFTPCALFLTLHHEYVWLTIPYSVFSVLPGSSIYFLGFREIMRHAPTAIRSLHNCTLRSANFRLCGLGYIGLD